VTVCYQDKGQGLYVNCQELIFGEGVLLMKMRGREDMRRWLLAVCVSISITWAAAQPKVTIQGTLKGYFLTREGELVRRSVILTNRKVSESPKEKLHLLWAGYYFEGLLESKEPISGVRILLGDTLIYLRRFPKPTTKVALPDWKIPLRVHPRYGFPPILELEQEQGQRSRIVLQPVGVKILPLLSLKVDWLDFIRINLLRQFLERKGDNFLPGWRANEITFVLQGEDNQAVWINPPEPPKGTKRYKGPCPLNARIYVGKLPKVLEPEGSGLTSTILGYPVVILRYDPGWFSLPEYPLSQGRSEFSSLMRIGTILHETIHAIIFRSLSEPDYEAKVTVSWLLGDFPKIYTKSWTLVPVWVPFIKQGADYEWQKALQQFLTVRAALRQQAAKFMAYADEQAISEGIAHYLKELALKRFIQSPEAETLRQIDPYFPRHKNYTPNITLPEARLFAWMDQLGINWRELIRKRRFQITIDELLESVVGKGEVAEGNALLRQWRGILDEETKKTEEWGWEEFRAYLRGERIAFWVQVNFALNDARKNQQMREVYREVLRETAKEWVWVFPMEMGRFSIYRPCLVSCRTLNPLFAEFGFFLRPDELLWIRWQGYDLELKTKEMNLYVPNAQIKVSQRCVWLKGTLFVPNNKKLQLIEEVPKMRKAWMLLTPLMLVTMIMTGHAQPEGVTVTATITGLFYDALTGQQQYLTLDLEEPTNNPPGDWHTIAGETYRWYISVTDAESRLEELTLLDEQGNVVIQKTANPPTNKLEVTDEHLVSYSCRPVKGSGWEIEFKLFPPKFRVRFRKGHETVPVQSGKLVVITIDSSGNRLPYTTVIVEGGGEIRGSATDESGEWWTYLTPGVNYSVKVGGSGLGAPSLCWRGPFKFKLREREEYWVIFMLWRHYPIFGKIGFSGSPGNPELITVKAVKGNLTLTGIVNTAPGLDGYYYFVIPGGGGAPEAGTWTVVVEYPGAKSITPPSKSVTVPADCPLPSLDPKGAHGPVDAGIFTIEVSPSGGPPGGPRG